MFQTQIFHVHTQLTNTNTHTIRVEYWPASGTLRRLTINPTEETR